MSVPGGTLRLLLVQWGDYAEAEHRFARGGGETFYAQRYAVEYVAGIARAGNDVRVIAIGADAPLERLPSGVESMGLLLYPGRFRRPRLRRLLRLAEEWRPTHLLLHSPIVEMARWAVGNGVDVLPLIADSFRAAGLRRRLGYRRLAATLNLPQIRWVANHGTNAAADLVRIGVAPRKVLPYELPTLVSPAERAPKVAPADPDAARLVFVGSLVPTKGVGDVIEAVGLARARGLRVRATVVGTGDDATFRRLARDRGVEDRVEFTGRVTHDRVLALMNEGDVVVVPSHHAYPEGMPFTIYEGLASRTPVVISDHPMFAGRVVHRRSGMIFPAGNPAALLDAALELAGDVELYERLSRGADDVCARFFGPLLWDQVITRWLAGTPGDDAWLRQFALAP
jgi:glycosyltransferase involved in cell wall biosynthesis